MARRDGSSSEFILAATARLPRFTRLTGTNMAKKASSNRRYDPQASSKVENALRERKRGTLRSGRSGKKVQSRRQAVAIGLSQARREGAKVPRK